MSSSLDILTVSLRYSARNIAVIAVSCLIRGIHHGLKNFCQLGRFQTGNADWSTK
jgi:hypothetical protein